MLLRFTATAIVFLSAIGTTCAYDAEKHNFQQLHRLSQALQTFNFPENRDHRITVWRQVGSTGISATIDEDEVTLKFAIDSFSDGDFDMDLDNVAVLSDGNRRIRFIAYDDGSGENANTTVRRGDLVVLMRRSFSTPAHGVEKETAPVHHQTGTWSTQGEVLVVVSSTRTTIAAYSIPKGTWARVELESPLDKKVKVTIGGTLAAFQTKDSIYAFSADTGRWARLKLPVDDSGHPVPAKFAVHEKMVRVTDEAGKNMLYVFSVNSTEWSGIDLTTGHPLSVRGFNY